MTFSGNSLLIHQSVVDKIGFSRFLVSGKFLQIKNSQAYISEKCLHLCESAKFCTKLAQDREIYLMQQEQRDGIESSAKKS